MSHPDWQGFVDVAVNDKRELLTELVKYLKEQRSIIGVFDHATLSGHGDENPKGVVIGL